MTTITLTDELIDHLIGARNRITDRTDEFINYSAVDHIDAVLREVPQGQRPDVDRLLGRYARIAERLDRHGSRIAPTPERVADVEPLCEATMEKWHEYLAGMSPAEVAIYNIWKENHATTDQP